MVDRVLAFLHGTAAPELAHPGGTLFAHLVRVHGLLRDLGAAEHVCLAGLTHAAYGTAGFDVPLLDRAERARLVALIGEPAEQLVYRYCACDRSASWPSLTSGVVWDRFTGDNAQLTGAELTAFADLSTVNELDVLAHSAEVDREHGADLRALFTRWRPILSPALAARL